MVGNCATLNFSTDANRDIAVPLDVKTVAAKVAAKAAAKVARGSADDFIEARGCTPSKRRRTERLIQTIQ